jgi:hypothetical protein
LADAMPLEINRAPVLTLWAAIVAERLGHPADTAFSADYLCAADFPLPGLVAPGSVVPPAVPLAVPALGVIPDEKPVWGDAPAPGLLLALEALEFVRLAEPS